MPALHHSPGSKEFLESQMAKLEEFHEAAILDIVTSHH
jgi:hypothetical protein